MLTPFDEYPFHQVTAPFGTVATSDQHWNDGHYICLCDNAGQVSLCSTVRFYQNNDVADGFVCLRHDGKQYNFRVSRRLRPDFELSMGPLRMEVIEPLKSVRLVLDANDIVPITLDIVCTTTAVPWVGPVSVSRPQGVLISERLTYEITGVVSGHATVNGRRFDFTPADTAFFRNHSWGFMGGRGGPRQYSAPIHTGPPRTGLRNWVLYWMPDHGGFFEFLEDADGNRMSGSYTMPDGRPYPAFAVILGPDAMKRIESIEHDLTFYEGSSRLMGGTLRLRDEDGRERQFTIEDMGWVYCQGGGYFGGFNDGLGQGIWRGEYYEEGEVWDVSQPERIFKGDEEVKLSTYWAESFVRLREGDTVGLAHYESVVFGSYPRYGLGMKR